MKRLDELKCLRCERVLPRSEFDTCTMASGRTRPYERCKTCRAEVGWYEKGGREPIPPPNPSGRCQCGCGAETPIATRNHREFGHVQGHPTKYIAGHGSHVTSGPMWEVNELTGCWIWLRATGRGTGYNRGQVGAWDKATKTRRHMPATRWVYEQYKGPIPEGLELDHLCRNPICVNPDHLEPVTHAENMRRIPKEDEGGWVWDGRPKI